MNDYDLLDTAGIRFETEFTILLIDRDRIFSQCSGQNFARRTECYRCSAPKTDTCVTLSSGPGNHSSTGASGDSFTETVSNYNQISTCVSIVHTSF